MSFRFLRKSIASLDARVSRRQARRRQIRRLPRRIESVEDRTLLSISLLSDIHPGAIGSNPGGFVEFNGDLYFVASDPDHGSELRRLRADGTVELVVEVTPGPTGGNVSGLTVFNGELYFAAERADVGRELFKLGSNDTVVLVADLRTGTEGSFPSGLAVAAGSLFFSADDGTSGIEPWKVSANGQASPVADLNIGASSSAPQSFIELNGEVFFTATTAATGRELFKIQGNGLATIARDIRLGPESSFLNGLTKIGGRIYFQATNGVVGFELWRVDTNGSVDLFLEINNGAASGNPAGFIEFNGDIFFKAVRADVGSELWRTTPTGTLTLVEDFFPGTNGLDPLRLTVFQNALYFSGINSTSGRQVYRFVEGTGIEALPEFVPGALNNINSITSTGDRLFVVASTPPTGAELWEVDAAGGLTLIDEVVPGPNSSTNISSISLFQGRPVFAASTPTTGVELFGLAGDDVLFFDQTARRFKLGTNTGSSFTWTQSGQLPVNIQALVGDFDGDGDLDGGYINFTTKVANLIRNNGDGTLSAPINRGSFGTSGNTGNYHVLDVDGDGKDELLYQFLTDANPADAVDPVGQIWSKSFDTGAQDFKIRVQTNFIRFAAGDFNGDFKGDLVGLILNQAGTATNIVSLYSVNNGGNLTAVLASGSFGAVGVTDLQVADLNGDVLDDIVVQVADGRVFHATTTGNLRPVSTNVHNFVSSNRAPTLNSSTFPNGFLLGQHGFGANHDLIAFDQNGNLRVFETTKNPAFLNPAVISMTSFSPGQAPVEGQLVIGDFNGDSFDDILVLGTNALMFPSNTIFIPEVDPFFNFGSVLGGTGQVGPFGVTGRR